MGNVSDGIKGIPKLYRSNAISLITFGAIQHARITRPDQQVTEIVKSVAENFGMEGREQALETEYYRTLRNFQENGGL